MQTISRHQCVIYEGSPARHLSSLAARIKEKLKGGSRCLFLNSPAMVAGMRSYLSALGTDVSREVEVGSLMLSSDVSHLVDGRFSIEKMIEKLDAAVRSALADGFNGLFATGDMTWEFGGEKNFEKLLAYERALETFMSNTPAISGVCQYHLDTLPEDALETALVTHPALYLNETLSRINPYYSEVDPEWHSRPRVSRAELKRIFEAAG
jgi:hypothetical protein